MIDSSNSNFLTLSIKYCMFKTLKNSLKAIVNSLVKTLLGVSLDDLLKKINDLEKQNKELQKEIKQLKERNKILREQNEKLSKEINQLKKQLEEERKKTEEYFKVIKFLETKEIKYKIVKKEQLEQSSFCIYYFYIKICLLEDCPDCNKIKIDYISELDKYEIERKIVEQIREKYDVNGCEIKIVIENIEQLLEELGMINKTYWKIKGIFK